VSYIKLKDTLCENKKFRKEWQKRNIKFLQNRNVNTKERLEKGIAVF
jgi:hypothetical protein